MAEGGESLAEVLTRGAFGHVRPEKGSESGTRVGVVGLQRQVDEEGANLIVFEAADGLAVPRKLHWTQQGNG
jgi:hypothetical protein